MDKGAWWASPWGHKVTHDQGTEQQTLPRSGGSFSDRLRRKKKGQSIS